MLRLHCIYKELSKNKLTHTLMSECYCDSDQYMAHVQQMVQIRPERSHHYHLSICPTMVRRLTFQGKTLLSSVCIQEVITCFTSTSIAITCLPGASQGSVSDTTLNTRLGLMHNLSDVQP